jgi:hypothetical protein
MAGRQPAVVRKREGCLGIANATFLCFIGQHSTSRLNSQTERLWKKPAIGLLVCPQDIPALYSSRQIPSSAMADQRTTDPASTWPRECAGCGDNGCYGKQEIAPVQSAAGIEHFTNSFRTL